MNTLINILIQTLRRRPLPRCGTATRADAPRRVVVFVVFAVHVGAGGLWLQGVTSGVAVGQILRNWRRADDCGRQ
jgi:hypothetical protein